MPRWKVQGNSSKGVDDLCFHTYEESSPSPPSSNWDLGLWADRSWIWDLGVEDKIWALRLGFGSWGSDSGLEAGGWALRLGYGHRG